MLNDPEPPPQPWWIKALGVASGLVVVTSSIVGVVGVSDHARRNVASNIVLSQPPPGCDPDKGRGLRGLGATPLDWGYAHTAAYTPLGNVTRWNPDPRLPRFRGHEGAVYNSTITAQNCAIASYFIRLVHPSSPATALRRARAELPKDAHSLWHRRLPQCVQYQLSSARLATRLDERGYDGPKPTAVLVNLMLRHPADTNSITKVGLSLVGTSFPDTTGGCVV